MSDTPATGVLNRPLQFLFGDPGAGYREAARGADQVASGFDRLGNTQWGRQMEGLQGALGGYGQAQNLFNNLYGNPTGAATASGDYWRQTQPYWTSPTNSQGAYGTYGNQYLNGSESKDISRQAALNLYNPTATSTAQGQAMGYVGAPSAQGRAYDNYTSWMNHGSEAEGAYRGAQSTLGGPSSTSQAYGQVAPQYGQAGAAENYYQQASGQMGAPGAAENFYAQNQGLYNPRRQALQQMSAFDTFGAQAPSESGLSKFTTWGDGPAQDFAKRQDITLSQPGALTRASADLAQGYQNANDMQRFSATTAPQLAQQGLGEQWAQMAINGNNPALARERQQGQDALNQQMIARGMFGSGAAVKGLAEYNAALDAANYKNMGELAQGAQGLQMQRLAQGQGLAGATSGEKFQTTGALQGLASGQESEFMNRNQALQGAVNSASGENLGQRGQTLQAMHQADTARLGREQAMVNMMGMQGSQNLDYLNAQQGAAGNAQNAALARMMGLGNLAQSAQGFGLQRMQGLMGAAGQNDQTDLARAMGLYNMGAGVDAQATERQRLALSGAQGLDQDALARAGLIFGMGQGADQAYNARMALAGNLAGQSDQMRIAGLNGYFAAANSADTSSLGRMLGGANVANNTTSLEQARMQQMLAQQIAIANGSAGAYGQFYGQGGNFYGNAIDNSLNALMAAAVYRGQGMGAQQMLPFSVSNAASQWAPGRGGGGGGGGGGRA